MSAVAAQIEVKEHPILFKPEMMRAILAGHKWVTRRLRGLKHINESPNDWELLGKYAQGFKFFNCETEETVIIRSPYGEAGDKLWTRETHSLFKGSSQPSDLASAKYACFKDGSQAYRSDSHIYFSDRPYEPAKWPTATKWRPSIFQPRWASRLTLDIVRLWPERLQRITEEDAIAEGVDYLPSMPAATTHRTSFAFGWSKINPKSPWEKNDWVWRIEFPKVGQHATSEMVAISTDGKPQAVV